MQGRIALAQAYVVGRHEQRDRDSCRRSWREPRVASTLAQFQEQVGRPQEAAESYTKALAVAPNSRELKVRRIAALVAAKDFQRAADFAGQAQTQHPDDLRFPQFRAHALLQMGDAPRAISVLEPVAKANPNDGATQLSLADLYSNAGRKNDAERTVRQLVTLEPGKRRRAELSWLHAAERGQQLDGSHPPLFAAHSISSPDNPKLPGQPWLGVLPPGGTTTRRRSTLRPRSSRCRATPRPGSHGRHPREGAGAGRMRLTHGRAR